MLWSWLQCGYGGCNVVMVVVMWLYCCSYVVCLECFCGYVLSLYLRFWLCGYVVIIMCKNLLW